MKNKLLVKIITVLISTATVVSLFACDGGNGNNETTAGNTEMTTEAADVNVEQTTETKVDEVATSAADVKVAETEAAAAVEVTTEADIGIADMGIADAANPSASGQAAVDHTSIIELNKDREAYIIQGASGRSEFFNDKYVPLQFVHCSDMHAKLDNWNRMVEFTNHYSDYISFVMHSGDYVGGTQGEYVDFYKDGLKCDVEIFNCVGNHDTMKPGVSQQQTSDKATVHKLLFGEQYKGWGATFMEGEYSTAYYKDFPESNVRLIVLDLYYDIGAQKTWLRRLLDEALEEGYHVITVMHEPSDRIYEPVDTAFHSINDWESLYTLGKHQIEDEISSFIDAGGIHVANLAGHEHHDLFGYTLGGVLNAVVECGTSWRGWCDADRVENTRTYDSFNVVSIDTNLGIIKVIRIGNNSDNFLREKSILCYDYINKRVITDGSGAGMGSGNAAQPDVDTQTKEVDFYLTPAEIAKDIEATGNGIKSELKSENGVDFIRLTRTVAGNSPSWNSSFKGADGNSGKYLVFKYRSNAATQWLALYSSTQNPSRVGDDLCWTDYNGDEQWHVFVVDMQQNKQITKSFVADESGNFKAQYIGFTLFYHTTPVTDYVDFAYVTWAETVEEAYELIGDGEDVRYGYCDGAKWIPLS